MSQDIKEYLEKYLNKVDIGYRLSPGVNLEEFWKKLVAERNKSAEAIELKDQKGRNFWFNITHSLQKKLHEIDSDGRDTLFSAVKNEIADEMVKESLIEEALNSSIIEGAFSTLKRAKELITKNETPRDNSEQMILNNFYAMRFTLENLKRPFSREIILELHKIVTEKTLDEGDYAGKFRDDQVYVVDKTGQAIYTPPPANEIEGGLERLINWINTDQDEAFIHPIVKASILHFYFVYLHPFFDGNGRTARALFYYYLLKNKYDFFKYFSISSIIQKNRSAYYKSLKDVEDYDSDLTYFLVFMADSVVQAISEIRTKIAKHYRKEYFLNKIREKGISLNQRQDKFIRKVLLWGNKEITISKYQDLFKVVYQTARADLLDLAKKQILAKIKRQNKFVFIVNGEF